MICKELDRGSAATPICCCCCCAYAAASNLFSPIIPNLFGMYNNNGDDRTPNTEIQAYGY